MHFILIQNENRNEGNVAGQPTANPNLFYFCLETTIITTMSALQCLFKCCSFVVCLSYSADESPSPGVPEHSLVCSGAGALFSCYLTFQVLYSTSMSNPRDIHYADSMNNSSMY